MLKLALLLFASVAVKAQDASADHLMVVGGFPSTDVSELIDVDPSSGPSLDCVSPAPFPQDIFTAAGGVVNGMPVVCGGDQGITYTSECHQYDPATNTWSQTGDLAESKGYMGWASDASWGLVVSGGDGLTTYDTVERTLDGTTFEQLAPLPSPRRRHCMAIIDDTRLFVAGGYRFNEMDEALVYESGSGAWTEVSPMPTPRYNHVCGVVAGADDTTDIVISGGYDGRDFLSLVEIYNVEGDAWRTGSPLPQAINSLSIAGFGGSFLLVGGFDGEVELDTIYEYDVQSGDWVLREQRLATAKNRVNAMMVHPDAFPPC